MGMLLNVLLRHADKWSTPWTRITGPRYSWRIPLQERYIKCNASNGVTIRLY